MRRPEAEGDSHARFMARSVDWFPARRNRLATIAVQAMVSLMFWGVVVLAILAWAGAR